MESTYSAMSRRIIGTISAFAAAQSPPANHFSITAITRCTKIAGSAAEIAENRMQNTVTGASTG